MRRKLWGRFCVWEQYLLPSLWVAVFCVGISAALIMPVLCAKPESGEKQASAVVEKTAAPAAAEPCEKKVLPALLAGRWYTADRDQLAADLDAYLDQADTPPLPSVHALILPHAGYRYSGLTAAYGVKSVVGKRFSRVIVMGPTHGVAMRNVASVPDATHYATPLGEAPLDVEFLDALRAFPQFVSIPEAHRGEHSVQIEVPFLQQALGEFRLVPIVVGQLDVTTARTMAQILCSLIDEETLVVVSSDFTHYGPGFEYVPFREDIPENIEKLDMGAVREIEKRDPAGFMDYVEKTGATICGRNAIAVLLAMLPSDSEAHMVHYDTSGRMTGDSTNSVSYLSIAFTGRWRKGEPMEAQNTDASLSEQDEEQLLKLARGTLEYYLEHKCPPTPEALGVEITPSMEAVMGAFVTLHKDKQLRGCIGEIFPRRPLYEAVIAHAVNAGVNDHRFAQVEQAEVPSLHFEISALTQPAPVDSQEDIIIGKHGIVIDKNGRRAVFLPQVAPEQGWSLKETLEHLCAKAGLPRDAWQEGMAFTVFEAIVFSEDRP
jgi:MEMO1 family protein